jgi:hypothetical protein
LLTVTCTLLGAAALVAAIYVESAPARADAGEERAIAPTIITPVPSKSPSSSSSSPSSPSTTSSHPTLAATISPALGAPSRPSLTVPDFKGKRLSAARREGRELGLTVAARDEGGDRVPAALARYYRVRRQLTEAGTPVEPGAAIEVRVREIGDAVSGY